MSKTGMSPMTGMKIWGRKGSNLRSVRVLRGLSQTELAEKSGVSVKNIRRYEQIPNTIESARLKTLCALCITLDCSVADLIEDGELLEMYTKAK